MRYFSTWLSSHTLKSFEPRIYFHLNHSQAEKETIKYFIGSVCYIFFTGHA